MTDLKFATVDIPETTRPRRENPFAPLVKDMIEKGGARQFEMPTKTEDDEKALASAINLIHNAGRDADKSVRKVVKRDGGKATITVWVVEKITRERKPKDESTESATGAEPVGATKTK